MEGVHGLLSVFLCARQIGRIENFPCTTKLFACPFRLHCIAASRILVCPLEKPQIAKPALVWFHRLPTCPNLLGPSVFFLLLNMFRMVVQSALPSIACFLPDKFWKKAASSSTVKSQPVIGPWGPSNRFAYSQPSEISFSDLNGEVWRACKYLKHQHVFKQLFACSLALQRNFRSETFLKAIRVLFTWNFALYWNLLCNLRSVRVCWL